MSDTAVADSRYPHDVPNPELIEENLNYEKEDLKKTLVEQGIDDNQATLMVAQTKFQEELNSKDEEVDVPNKFNKNCLHRWFDKIRGGSLRGSIFAVASVTFGGGCLAFPAAMAQSGLMIGFLIFFLAAILSYITLRYLLDIGLQNKTLDYNELVKMSVGDNFRVFADINNIILCIGVVMTYQYMIYQFIENILNDYAGYKVTTFSKLMLVLGCMILIQIPLGLLKNISVLQYASLLATISLGYCILVIFFEFPFYYKQYMNDNKDFEIGLFPPGGIKWNWLDSVGTFLFGFCNHNGIFQVFMEMDRPNKRRSVKVLNRSMILELVLYTAISIGGFFSFFYKCPDIFLNRPDLNGFRDYFNLIAKITLIICLNCVMAINYNIMRLSITSLGFNGVPPSWTTDFVITVITYILSNTIVFFVKNATRILGFIGGISTVVISFVCPVLIDIKLGNNPRYHWRNIMNYIILVVISLLGVASTVKSVISFIDDLKNPTS